ncbi:hypothetical protein F7R05_05155 [Pseudomonas koreensis]|nr:hypothetical protein F7R05_05155 [Pseudomonas koreensis]
MNSAPVCLYCGCGNDAKFSAFVARELAPARLRSSRNPVSTMFSHQSAGFGAASQPSGSKLPRHSYVISAGPTAPAPGAQAPDD